MVCDDCHLPVDLELLHESSFLQPCESTSGDASWGRDGVNNASVEEHDQLQMSIHQNHKHHCNHLGCIWVGAGDAWSLSGSAGANVHLSGGICRRRATVSYYVSIAELICAECWWMNQHLNCVTWKRGHSAPSVINFLVYPMPSSQSQGELSVCCKVWLDCNALCHEYLCQLGPFKEICHSNSTAFSEKQECCKGKRWLWILHCSEN